MRTTMNQTALALLLAGLAITGCQLPVEGLMNSSKDPANGGTANQPAPPTGVSASASNGQVTIQWTAVTGATSYNIYWSTTTGVTPATGTKIASAVSPYTQTGLTNGTAYYYVITALVTSSGNSSLESNASSQVGATPQVSAPGAPTAFGASAGNGQVTLTWTAINGALSYNIYRSTTSNFTKSASNKIANPTGTTYNDTTVSNGTTYYYLVTAMNPGGESSVSSQVGATPQVSAPGAPTGFSASPGNGQVTLSWTAISGALSYNVYRSTTSNFTKSASNKIANPTTNSYNDTTVSNGTTYYYLTTAMNPGGESSASPYVSATPQIPAPSAPTNVVATPSYNQNTITWNTVSGATSYNIYWSTSSGLTPSTGTKIPSVSSGYVQSGLGGGVALYYLVTAVNAGGESVASTPASATPLYSVYAGGYSDSTGNSQTPGYWKNGTWNGLPQLLSGVGVSIGAVMSLAVSGGNIYAVGWCEDGSGNGQASYWLNGSGTLLPTLSTAKLSMAVSVVVYGNDIYIGGYCQNSSGVIVPGYWLNGNWVGLTPISSTENAQVNSLQVVNGNVYATGECNNASGIGVPGYWLNGTWNALPSESSTQNSQTCSIFVVGGDVLIGGQSQTSTIAYPTYWYDGLLTSLPLDPNATIYNGAVFSVSKSSTDLYAGGYRYGATSIVPGYWDNGLWNQLPTLSGSASVVESVVFVGGHLYCGGYSIGNQAVPVPGYWLDGTWVQLSQLSTISESQVYSIVVQ